MLSDKYLRCGVCRGYLVSYKCKVCNQHVCQRCGRCTSDCAEMIARRKIYTFPAYRSTPGGTLTEAERREKAKRYMDGG